LASGQEGAEQPSQKTRELPQARSADVALAGLIEFLSRIPRKTFHTLFPFRLQSLKEDYSC